MVGVILAGGDGVRLRESSGKDCCKSLEKVAGVSLIEYALKNLVVLGIEKAVIVVGKQGELIKKALGLCYEGVALTYVNQAEQKGLINAFVQALKETEGRKVVLQLADEIFAGFRADEVQKQIADKNNRSFYCGITREKDPDKIRANYSVELDGAEVIKCVEKPVEIINDIKGTGFCVFSAEAVRILEDIYDKKNNSPKDLCDFMNLLTANDKKGDAFCVAEKEFNINTLSDLEEAERFCRGDA